MLIKIAGNIVEEKMGNAHGVAPMDGVVEKMALSGHQAYNQMVVMEHLVVQINIVVF